MNAAVACAASFVIAAVLLALGERAWAMTFCVIANVWAAAASIMWTLA
jgi:hypothetical protein